MIETEVDEWGVRRIKWRKRSVERTGRQPVGFARPPRVHDVDPWGLRSAPKGEGGPRAALTWAGGWAFIYAPVVALLAHSGGVPFLEALGHALVATPVFALLGFGGPRKRHRLYLVIFVLLTLLFRDRARSYDVFTFLGRGTGLFDRPRIVYYDIDQN